MVINMLQHTVYTLMQRQDDEQLFERMDSVSGFIDEMIENAAANGRPSRLVPTLDIMNMVRNDERMNEIIDLTYETDEETESEMED